MGDVTYRPARKEESRLVLEFIRELAAYEKLLDKVVSTEEDIIKNLFGENPNIFCIFVEKAGKVAGFCLCFYTYSTFQGRPGIFIEDLYVREEYRGQGLGKGFFNYLSKKAIDEDCCYVQWHVLDWNTPSIEFYDEMGGKPMNEWILYRLEKPAMEKLAG